MKLINKMSKVSLGVNMKYLIIILLTLSTITSNAETQFYSLFSPHEGVEAFNILYTKIKKSKKYIYASIYSWSDKEVTDSLKVALLMGIEVKLVLHPSLAKKSKIKKTVLELEMLGADIKVAKMNMHEKFFVIDDHFLLNTSANLSGGGKYRYSENFIFHSNQTIDGQDLISQFKKEFAILWNSARDIISNGEEIADQLPLENLSNNTHYSNSSLYSSSMNFKIILNKPSSKAYKQGKYFALKRIGGVKNQTWVIRDLIINKINTATKNIYLSLNHFNIREISDALINAVKRGVEVKLAVDNQEFKKSINNKEMTPQFVKDWKELPGNANLVPPIRVKYYSHSPSPRHWLLNHHKFILIDYDESNFENSILISGSYNLSKTAEHNQFDNMVLYRSAKNKDLFKRFYNEFQNQWTWNRTTTDKPDQRIVNLFTTLKDQTSLPLHLKEAISLNWNEILNIRKRVSQLADGFFSKIYRNRDCLYYDVRKEYFWGCPK